MAKKRRRAGHPAALLEVVSQVVTASERRPGAPQGSEPARPDLAELVASFVGTDLAATTAVLHLLAAVVDDETIVAEINEELARRTHRLPAAQVSETRVDRVFEMRHVLRDGESYFLDVRLPDGFRMTTVVYVDNNNLGQVVKDAYVLDRPFSEVLDRILAELDEDTQLLQIDLAEARARIEAALAIEPIMFPPLESDSWPGCRALVRWLVSSMPGGVTLPDPSGLVTTSSTRSRRGSCGRRTPVVWTTGTTATCSTRPGAPQGGRFSGRAGEAPTAAARLRPVRLR